ncbi:MAG TPA: hypothetical protein VJ722_09920 [Rhodanobacteraceae bacterium]|nr:hypothetical protein [Rhodanobacteraceae bacterium]
MKASNRLFLALAVGALVLQGCADTGGTRMEDPPVAQAPVANATMSAAPAAAAPAVEAGSVVTADTKDNFEAIVAAIHQQMQPGGRWQYIDNGERVTIDGSFADMGKLYDRFGTVEKMDRAAKTRLLLDQSTINTILTKKDGERLICQNQIPVGSHLPVKTCKTYAQIRAEQNNAQEYLRTHVGSMQRRTGN